MRKILAWVFTLALLGNLAVGAIFLYRLGRAERDKEAERETPIAPPARLTRTKEGELVLTFTAEERTKLGFKSATLEEKLEPLEAISYGRVLASTSLLGLENERSQAEAALAASQADYERTRTLFQENENASRKALDQARAQFRADELRLRGVERQLATEWGDVVTSLQREAQDALAERISKRKTALVRVTLLPGEILGTRPKGARVSLSGREDRFAQTSQVFDAPQVDPKSQGQGFILRLDDAGPLFGPGAAVTAYLRAEGEPRKGVEIPNSAIVRYAGKNWVYALVDESHLSRREVSLNRPTKAGWFSISGVVPKTEIIVEGPQTLLSEELKGEIHVSD